MAGQIAQWVKSICCSSRGPGFSSPSTHVVAHNSLIPVSKNPMFWTLHSCYTCRQNSCTYKKKILKTMHLQERVNQMHVVHLRDWQERWHLPPALASKGVMLACEVISQM